MYREIYPDLVFNTKTKRWKSLGFSLNVLYHSATLVHDKMCILGGKGVYKPEIHSHK